MEDRDDIAEALMAKMSPEEREHFVEIIRKAEDEKLKRARRRDPDDTTEPR